MFGRGATPIVVLSKLNTLFLDVSFVWLLVNKFLTMSCILIIAGQNTKRDTGRKVQKENIQAGKVNVLF